MSRELADFYNWGHFALTNGINYDFTRHPERYSTTWNMRDLSPAGLEAYTTAVYPIAW